MPQSLAKVVLHIIFSTKNREPYISKKWQPKLHAYLAGACRGNNSEAYRVGGVADHVHIACSLPRTLTISKLVEEIKKTSSAWMKKQDPRLRKFSWQAGYGAFSVAYSQLFTLIHYIESQADHHRKKTYQEEMIGFLREYDIHYDENYLWD